MFGGTSAAADEPVREVTHDPTAYPAPSVRWPLLGLGAATTAVWYGAALGGSYFYPTARGADELRFPIAGPWMSLAQTGCPETTPDCSTFWMVVGVIVKSFDGIGQAGGLLVMAEGLLLPTVEPRRTGRLEYDARAPRRSLQPPPSLQVFPAPFSEGLGASIVGLF